MNEELHDVILMRILVELNDTWLGTMFGFYESNEMMSWVTASLFGVLK